MTLEQFAFRISGPIDFLLNLAINTAIPWFVLRHTAEVPLLGWLSLFIFVGPMVFCVLSIATFCGQWNGVVQRNHGVPPGPLAPGTRWAPRALGKSLGLAVFGFLFLLVTLVTLDAAIPGLRLPAGAVIAIDGVGSAVLGYICQVSGVLAARRF